MTEAVTERTRLVAMVADAYARGGVDFGTTLIGILRDAEEQFGVANPSMNDVIKIVRFQLDTQQAVVDEARKRLMDG